MNFEPVPLPEPPSLFDIDALDAGGTLDAIGWYTPQPGPDFAWLPWGLLWPVHDLTIDEPLPWPSWHHDDAAPQPAPALATSPAEIGTGLVPSSPEVRSTLLRSGVILLLVVLSMAALLAIVVGIIITVIVLALQSALG